MSSEMKENIQVLDSLLENEKKSRTLTLVSIIGFCILALSIVILSVNIHKIKEERDQEHSGRLIAQDSLETVLLNLTHLQDSLRDASQLFNRLAVKSNMNFNESFSLLKNLQTQYDSLYNLNVKFRKERKMDKFEKYDQQIKEKTAKIESYSGLYKCYIQYMPGFETDAKKVYNALVKAEWYGKFVADNEKIVDQTFNSYIKYFDKNDKEWADKINKAIQDAGVKLDKDPVLAYTPGASKHIEIWLGKAKKQTVEDILRNPNYQNQMNQNIRQQ